MSRFLCITLNLSVLTLLFVSAAHGETVNTVPEVVVSANRYPIPITQVASSVTVITEEEIKTKQKTSVVDLLRDIPGVVITNAGGANQTSRVLLRGAESRHTLVVVDGITINDPSDVGNAVDFAYLTPDNIERIEVLRGPQSTLYGPDAIGGVVNIITKKGAGKPTFYANAEAGSYKTMKGSVGSSGAIDRFSYSVNVSRMETSGISSLNEKRGGAENDKSQNLTVSGNVGLEITDNFRINAVGRTTNGFADYDRFSPTADTRFNRNTTKLRNGRISGNLALFDNFWEQEVGLAAFDIHRDDNNVDFGPSIYDGTRKTADWIHRLKFTPNHILTAGLETSKDEAETSFSSKEYTRNNGFYLNDQFSLFDNFYTSVGMRIDRHSTFGTQTTYRITPSYIVPQTRTKLKASYGTGFKAPSLFQLYDPFSGNLSLDPEESRGYDIGFEQPLWGDIITFGSTYYHNNISNLIDFDFGTFRYFNAGNVRTEGFENFITIRPAVDLTLSLNHTYLDARNKETGTRLLRRPNNTASISADYRFLERGQAGIAARVVDKRDDTTGQLPAYGVVDVNASWQLTQTTQLYGRIDNLLDKQYEEVLTYGTPGVSGYMGVRLNF